VKKIVTRITLTQLRIATPMLAPLRTRFIKKSIRHLP
jgi:hypothetical protein